jgi:hypothetical protein
MPVKRSFKSNLAGAAEHRLPIRQAQTRSQCQTNAVSTAARGSRTVTSEPSRWAGSPPESRRPQATRGGCSVRERTAGPGERPPRGDTSSRPKSVARRGEEHPSRSTLLQSMKMGAIVSPATGVGRERERGVEVFGGGLREGNGGGCRSSPGRERGGRFCCCRCSSRPHGPVLVWQKLARQPAR